VELHATGRVQRLDERTELRPECAFQRHGVGCDHVDIEAAFAQRARRLHPDEAGADQCDRTCLPASRDDRPRIRKRAQRKYIRAIEARQRQRARLRAGGDQQRVVADPFAVGELDLARTRVDRSDFGVHA